MDKSNNNRLEWFNACDKMPPVGKILSIMNFDSYGNEQVNFGFYANSGAFEGDFDLNCLKILTLLSGKSAFYKYDQNRDKSQPVSSVVSWTLHNKLISHTGKEIE